MQKGLVTFGLFVGTAVGGYTVFQMWRVPDLQPNTARGEAFRPLVSVPKEPGGRPVHVTVLVTGATGGIGKSVTSYLCKEGAKLFLGCRDVGKCAEFRLSLKEQYPAADVTCLHVDMASQKSVTELADSVKEATPRLDAWVNCVGEMGWPKRHITADGVERHLATHFLSPVLLSRLLEPLLAKSGDGRIVQLHSEDFLMRYRSRDFDFNNLNFSRDNSYDGVRAFQQSQVCLFLWLHEEAILARRRHGGAVRYFGVTPGNVNTDLYRHMAFMNFPPSRWIFGAMQAVFFRPKYQGAVTPLYCIMLQKPPDAILLKDMHESHLFEQATHLWGEERIKDWTTKVRAVAHAWTKPRD